MKKLRLFRSNLFPVLFIFGLVLVSCKKKESDPEKLNETILEGTTTILVDQTVQPIIEDQVAVFENQYRAKINLVNKSETEVVNDLITDKAKIAILSRTLNEKEQVVFKNKKIYPKITKFAVDAVALVTNNQSQDTVADLEEIIKLMQSKNSKVKGLVFENANSSTIRYLSELSKITALPKEKIFALNSDTELYKFISENAGLIGVVGLNTIVQPTAENQIYLKKIKVMGVRNLSSKPNNLKYYKPSQENLALGVYPLQRELYMLNYQGSAGLGMGFASFIAGEIGQRIILKSGLLPVRMPGRELNIRSQILKQ